MTTAAETQFHNEETIFITNIYSNAQHAFKTPENLLE